MPQLNLGMQVLRCSPPLLLFPVSSNLAKINRTNNRSTCPVLVFSGNAWGEHRSVSINFSSETLINGWSRRERETSQPCLHTRRGSPALLIPLISSICYTRWRYFVGQLNINYNTVSDAWRNNVYLSNLEHFSTVHSNAEGGAVVWC